MAKNTPKVKNENTQDTSTQAYVARLKNKGFLPELDQAGVAKRNKALSDKLKNVDVSPFAPLPTSGNEPYKVPFPNFGQSRFSNNVCSDEENNEESTMRFRR